MLINNIWRLNIFIYFFINLYSSKNFQCPPLSPHKPKNIHDLHPNNIKVIMALGDSITAAYGAMGFDTPYILDEFRGLSHSIGGDKDAFTLANFFSFYNPELQGASIGQHMFELPGWEYYPNDNYNAAQSGAFSGDLIEQVKYLKNKLLSNSKIDFFDDWKLMTILIGANDACPLCSLFDDNHTTVEKAANIFEKNIKILINEIYYSIPRVLVNVLLMFNISQVYEISKGGFYCDKVHDFIPFECNCAFFSDSNKRKFLDTVLQAYNNKWIKIAKEWKLKKLKDFDIVIQPYSKDLKIPSLDYLSSIDCFHPSLLAHELLASSNWNSLITPGYLKTIKFDPFAPIKCPTNNTLLYTDYP